MQIAVMVMGGVFIWLAVTRNLSKVDSVAARLGSYETANLAPVANTESMPAEIKPLINDEKWEARREITAKGVSTLKAVRDHYDDIIDWLRERDLLPDAEVEDEPDDE